MGKIKNPSAVKLIAGFIFREEKILHKAEALLRRRFGQTDFESASIPFDYTDYYRHEIGDNLLRKFISFKKPVDPADLAGIKVFTNKIEDRFSCSGCRKINIDPGCLDLSKLLLATTKDYSHRIYLRKGIYAEVTLSYRGKSFRPLPWTYPDYATGEYIDIFNKIREAYARQTHG